MKYTKMKTVQVEKIRKSGHWIPESQPGRAYLARAIHYM
jgi:hypothetical protein